jgi:hypothetical protein
MSVQVPVCRDQGRVVGRPAAAKLCDVPEGQGGPVAQASCPPCLRNKNTHFGAPLRASLELTRRTNVRSS